MTRKYALLFIVIIIFVLTILEGFFGTHGYFVNQELSRALAMERFLRDEMTLEVESLQKRLDTVWDENELRDTALKLGYSVAGDTVYQFPELQGVEEAGPGQVKHSDSTSFTPRFKGIPFWMLFILSGVVALILSISIMKILTRYSRQADRKDEHDGKHS